MIHSLQNKFSPNYDIKINYTNRKKTIGLRINNNNIIINAPKFASLHIIEKFILKNINWIEKKIQIIQNQSNKIDNKISFLGKTIPLIAKENHNLPGFHFENQQLIYAKFYKYQTKRIFFKRMV